MKDIDIEKKIGEAVPYSAGQSVKPPFEQIARKIAEGQPSESFEAFFAEDIGSAKSSRWSAVNWKRIAGVSAAAVLAIAAGGIMLGVLLNGMTLKSESTAADAAQTMEYCVENAGDENFEEDTEQYVSDSDTAQYDTVDSEESKE